MRWLEAPDLAAAAVLVLLQRLQCPKASHAACRGCACHRHGGLHQWIAFVDADEFFVIRDARVATLPEVLRDYEEFGGLAVNWQVLPRSSPHTPEACMSPSIMQLLANLPRRMQHCAGLDSAIWILQMFGSSGRLFWPEGSTMAAYAECYPQHHLENHQDHRQHGLCRQRERRPPPLPVQGTLRPSCKARLQPAAAAYAS